MPAPTPRPSTIYLETFGCQMNVLDSQLVRGQLQGLGYRFVDDPKDAGVILYNTCSVREQAENKALSRIGEVGVLKRSRPEIILGVIGCMAERDGTDMARRHPQIDLLCGPGELDKIPFLIDNIVKTDLHRRGGKSAAQVALQGNTHRRSTTLAAAEDRLEMLDLSRSFDPDEHTGTAYVRITRGCNKFCTYCVVPNTRGAEVHRPPDHIVEECRRLVAAGVVEITLLGQTVNHYHYDHDAAVTIAGRQQPQVGSIVRHPGSPPIAQSPDHQIAKSNCSGPAPTSGPMPPPGGVTTFANLLARLHDEIPALHRLRFVTNFPRDFGDDILRVMAERPRICRYLHLPVQSGSNRILRLMNRGYTIEEYRALLARVRGHLPDVELATDLICGFPTETEEDHQATAALLRGSGFKNAFIFKYSPRPGTAAIDRFVEDVPEETKRRRNNELLAIQAEVSANVHRAYVGRTVRVFVESVSEHTARAAEAAATARAAANGNGASNPLSLRERVAATQSPPGEGVPGRGAAAAGSLLPVPGVPGTRSDSPIAKSPNHQIAKSSAPEPLSVPPAQFDAPVAAKALPQLTGRTDGDLIVCFDGDPSLIGALAHVRIHRAATLALFGELVPASGFEPPSPSPAASG